MSDTPQGPGWWQASDGRFYPPQSASPQPPPPPQWGGTAPPQWGPSPPRRRRGRGCLYSVLGFFGLIILLVIIIAVAANHAAKKIQSSGLGGPPPAAKYRVGQTGSSGGFAFTVYAVKDPFTSSNQFATPTAGDRYVEVDVQVKNQNTSRQEVFSSLAGFHLLDSLNHQYDEALVTGVEPSAPDGQIAAGQAIRGFVVFEVPKATTGLKLRCQGNLTSAGAVFTLP